MLSSLDGGYVEYSADGMVAVYDCFLGYTLVGVKNRFCATDGSGWDGNDSVCGKFITIL